MQRRQTLKTTVRALTLATIAVPGIASSQPDSTSIDTLLLTLERIESREPDGNRSAALIEPLRELAVRYQEEGDRLLAAAALDRALEVVRVNYGLYSLEQAPLIRQSIAVEEARANSTAVWEREQELLNLVQRNPEDVRVVPILRRIADDRMDALRRYVGGQYPPEIVLGCYYRHQRVNVYPDLCMSGSKGLAVRNLFLEARQHYETAIDVIRAHRADSADELRELEMKLIRANYFYGDEDEPPSRYERGKESFRRLIEYDTERADVLGQIESLVQLADWELLYTNYDAALATYTQAYERLARENAPREALQRLFTPDVPVVLPAFLPNPLVSPRTPESTGFVDVEFEITRYGKSKRVDVLDTTTDASRSATHDVTRLISSSRFRPSMRDGRFERSATFVVRYYLNE